jgi:hypothetical protein
MGYSKLYFRIQNLVVTCVFLALPLNLGVCSVWQLQQSR